MVFLWILPFSLLLSHTTLVLSQKCTSQTFTNNKLYTNCTDLPSLNSFLHYTYNPNKSSLSIAFIAPPPKSNGWIGWGINLNGTGMVGSQVLIAYKKSNGDMTVKTYNLVSYASVVQSELSFDVSDKSAEYSDGVMRIFAKIELPKDVTKFNQVWQVGADVDGDAPVKHEFKPENLNAKGELKVAEVQNNGTTAAGNSTTTPTGGGDKKNSGSRISERRFWLLYVTLLFIFGILAM